MYSVFPELLHLRFTGTRTIRGSYLIHADEHTKVFMNKIEELGLFIQKSMVIIEGKL